MIRPATPFLSGVGAVTRPDGAIVSDVAYEITASPRLRRLVPSALWTMRLNVNRAEALFWFFECGPGLRLTVSDGRVLPFGVSMVPDRSGWVAVTTPRSPWLRWPWQAAD